MTGDGKHCCRNWCWTEKELCCGMAPRLVGGRQFHNKSCIFPETPALNCFTGVYVMGVGRIGGPGAGKRCPVQVIPESLQTTSWL